MQAVCINDNLIILRSSTGQQHKLQRCDLKDCGTDATSIIKYEALLPNTDNEVVTGIAASDTILFIIQEVRFSVLNTRIIVKKNYME